MNIERIIRIASCYLFLTGYQIRWYDRKSNKFHLKICGILYFLMLFFIYLICLCHHFEDSSEMKTLLNLSPFLKDLVRLQVLLGCKVYILCIIGAKNLTKISNGLIRVFMENIKRQDSFDIWEACVYLLFFSTLLVAATIGLYIAIELKFEPPTLDQIMTYMALFIPHFTLAGCLRLYTLGLWLIRRDLVNSKSVIVQENEKVSKNIHSNVVVEICNPVLSTNPTDTTLYTIYEKISRQLNIIAKYLSKFDSTLQRQLSVLVGINFNCLLAGAYAYVYFENTWKVVFSNRYCRIVYAANSAIFVCVLVDYGILLFVRWSFCRAKQDLYNYIKTKLLEDKAIESNIKTILKHITYKLSNELNLKLFGLVEFNTWNFLMLHGLMITIIALIISHQYLSDQIQALNEQIK